MSISYCVCTEISEDGDIRADQTGYRDNFAKVMPAKRSRNHRSKSLSGPYSYACKYPAEVWCISDYWVSERKEQSDDIRSARKFKVEVWKSPFLG